MSAFKDLMSQLQVQTEESIVLNDQNDQSPDKQDSSSSDLIVIHAESPSKKDHTADRKDRYAFLYW